MSSGPRRFQAWLDEFFSTCYRLSPVNATCIGFHDFDDTLPELSESAIEAALRELRRLRREVREIPDESLDTFERFDKKLAMGHLDIAEWEYDSRYLLHNPAAYTGEAIFGAMSLLLTDFGDRERSLSSLRSRLARVPRLLEEARAHLETSPIAWTERAVRECGAALTFLETGLPLVDDAGRSSDVVSEAWHAFAGFRAFLEELRDSGERPQWRCGEDTFDFLLRKAHFLHESPEDVVRWARQEIARRTESLERGASRFGVAEWPDALARLRELHPSPAEYLDRFGELWVRSRAHVRERRLLSWPDFPVDYVERPEWARKSAPDLYFLFYRSPAPLDAPERVRYLVEPIRGVDASEASRILRATNDSVIKLNHVVHHGGVGHHVQNWYAMRCQSRIGQVAAVDCASRIAMLCGGTMAEGWACYATDLMDETGFLTELESYSQHHAHLRMAARAVVDVELHCGERGFEECAQFYQTTANMSAAAARAEVTKNSMFPGAALIYFVGTHAIHGLRHELHHRLGSAFDLETFHDTLLSFGSIPVSLIANHMLRAS